MSCVTISGRHETMILLSNRFDIGNFQNFALHSFLRNGILHNQRVKILIINLISLYPFHLT